jgi:pyridoxine 5'-phosphate synthase PdxJ
LNEKLREIQSDDLQIMTENVKKNVQINPENSENEENSQNSTVLNEQPQQRVPVP